MIRRTLFAVALLASTACSAQPQAAASKADPAKPFTTTVVADFESPWAMTRWGMHMLVTEKKGAMKLVPFEDGRVLDVTGVPAVDSEGQGGLMDVVAPPQAANLPGMLYFSYVEAGPGGKGVVLARAKLVEDGTTAKLENVQTLWRAPKVSGNGHYSGRIAFSPDGKYLFFTAGDRQKFVPAQDPKLPLGKVLRLTPDGKPAPGNPLTAKGFLPEVWSYGHRNLLGSAFDAQGNLWEQEMGPKGGDEVNLILPGRNYGWPNASNGSHYDGRDIPDHKVGDGYEATKVSWNPVISPGGLMIYSGSMFPHWKGDAFIGGLSSKALVRVDLNGTNAAKGDQWDMGARIREVEQGPDGAIWLLEDGGESQGRLLKLTAAAK